MWLVAGHGRRLPPDLLACMTDRIVGARDAWEAVAESVPLGLFGTIIGPTGATPADAPAALAAESPMAYELVRPSPM